MVVVGMHPMPPKVIKKEACLHAKFHQGCQRILDPRGTQTFKGGMNQRK
jgi:hypothetical protein